MSWIRLPGRVPLRLRFFFRAVFLLLALATCALAVSVLQDERQRSQTNYAEGLRKNQAQIVARLRHPTGQLALLNPDMALRPAMALHPLVLPFSAIDFDDRHKAQQAAEMAGCLMQYPDGTHLCVAVGNNPYAGGFVYVVGSFNSHVLHPHVPGELDLTSSDRVRVVLSSHGQDTAWVAPFELDQALPGGGIRGRLTAFADGEPVTHATRPVRDFRGWLWQEGRCLDNLATDTDTCAKRAFMSVRLPVEVWREALFQKHLVWPPADLGQISVRVQVLAPGDGPAVFDSQGAAGTLPFSLADLKTLLLPGEVLTVQRLDGPGSTTPAATFRLVAPGESDPGDAQGAAWIFRLIGHLPLRQEVRPVTWRDVIETPLGHDAITLTGDARAVDRELAAVATRLSWIVGAMLLAIGLAWLAIELSIIRRVVLLTRRAASVSTGMRAADGLAHIDVSDLRGGDELGVLAQGLQDLLQRVNDDLRRERIRADQEKDMWHAVGHEIMSPLQSLMALHGSPGDASHRYITRMLQAVRVLYGHASPSEAFQSTTLQLQTIDLNAFLAHVARNAPFSDIADVHYQPLAQPVPVQVDEYSLEDVITHILRNADRYRPAGSAIELTLHDDDPQTVGVRVRNQGPNIAPDLLDKIFEYGVSDQSGSTERRGQGLFVAKTYMAKMGGTIAVRNVDGGVEFILCLPRGARPDSRATST